MRIDVQKYLVVGPASVQNQFFQTMQQLGIVEFIAGSRPPLKESDEIQCFIDALHVLRRMAPVKQEPIDGQESAYILARSVVDLERDLEVLREEEKNIEKEILRLEVFGDFALSEVKDFEQQANRVFQFFFCKKEEELKRHENSEMIFIDSANNLDYFIAINKERRSYEGFVEIIIEGSVVDFKDQLAVVQRKIQSNEAKLSELAHKNNLIKHGLINSLNQYNLKASEAKREQALEGSLFVVECWISKNNIKTVEKAADSLSVTIEPIKIESRDVVPTYLENKRFARIGEDLVDIYDTPSKEDKDPSLWVFVAFSIFFSMIVGDAGYGLLLLMCSLYLFFKYRNKGGMSGRVIKLAISLSLGCIFWGILQASFFGIDLMPNSGFRKLSIIDWMINKKADYLLTNKSEAYQELISEFPQLKSATTSEEFLMSIKRQQDGSGPYVVYNKLSGEVLIEVSLFIGALHIAFAFARGLRRGWSGIGWICFIVGAYIYFPVFLKSLSLTHYIFHLPYVLGGVIGTYLIFGGISLAVILAIVQNRLVGCTEVLRVINVFSDVVSYLRIYALSLAGVVMACTFNQVGSSLPIYIGVFVIFIGHMVNITLAIMGGVIHGLRLNFIEWYHYGFDGGGRKFCPLSLIEND